MHLLVWSYKYNLFVWSSKLIMQISIVWSIDIDHVIENISKIHNFMVDMSKYKSNVIIMYQICYTIMNYKYGNIQVLKQNGPIHIHMCDVSSHI